MTAAIELDRLWKHYGDYPALRDLSVLVPANTCTALLGRNGAGKTTLLRVLAGLSPFQQGTARVFGREPRSEEARRDSGVLGHGIGVYDDLSGGENLHFFATLRGLKGTAGVVRDWLARVELTRVADVPVRQYSRGMRQRLALARAFLHNPGLLLLDEPFTSLDDRAIAMLTGLLAEARNRGATVFISTHQLPEALQLATHVLLIENGMVRFSGTRTQEMLDDPGYLYRHYTTVGGA